MRGGPNNNTVLADIKSILLALLEENGLILVGTAERDPLDDDPTA